MEVHNTTVNVDVCACERRYLPRKRKWGCRKPLCDVMKNGFGCTDERRCRQPRKKQGWAKIFNHKTFAGTTYLQMSFRMWEEIND